MLRIRLIGGVAMEAEGRALPGPASRRAEALLAWLALHPGLHSRADVAARLWPDVVDTSARQSMRSALWSLRQVLDAAGVEAVVTTRDRIGIHPDVDVDVVRFDELVETGQLADAVRIGDADLMAGVDDEWALMARENHRERVVGVLGRLSRTADDPIQAVHWARRAAALDPLSEDAARTLMRTLVDSGDRPSALTVYQRLAERLRRELRVAPSEPTWRLAEQIRTGVDATPRQRDGRSRPKRAGVLPLVGRAAEIGVLLEAWRAAADAVGGLAIVHGAAGIGKTRLVHELIETARRDGGSTALGSPPDLAGEALTPWTEICGEFIGQLEAVPDVPWVDVLAPLVPGLVRTAPRSAASPDLEQARLAESVVALLEACAARGPVLVVLEDAHAADEASLAVLAHVTRRVSERRVLIVATRRERPLRDQLATLEQSSRQRGTLRADVALGPLDGRAVSRLARAVGPLTDDAVEQVVDVADGNALLAVEVARALAAGDALPVGLRGATRAAAARLPEDARSLVRTLAVAGRDLDAQEAAGRAGVDLAAALPPAEDQGLLVSHGTRIGFRHALLRESIYADMSLVERSRRHELAAEQLSALNAHGRAAEAAAHLRAIGRLAEAGQLLVRAAARARSLGALSDATTLLTEATQALPDDPIPALALADALAWRGRTADANAAFQRALPLLESAGDQSAVAEAFVRFAEWHYGPICKPRVSIDACRKALSVLDGAGIAAPELRARVLSVYAWSEAVAGDATAVDRVVGRLIDLVGETPADPEIAAQLDATRAFALLRQGRFDDAVAPAQRSAAISAQMGRPDLTYAALVNAAFGQAASGRMDQAIAMLDRLADGLAGRGMTAMEAMVLVYRAWVLSRLDRPADAAAAATQARRVADRLDTPDLQAVVDAERGRLALRDGDYAAAAALLADALGVREASIGRPLARLQRAEALARDGRLAEAEAELAEVVFEPVQEGDWPETLVIRMTAVEGLLAAGRGELSAARRQYAEVVAGWQRLSDVDLGARFVSVMADLGRPIIGLILPREELAAAETQLAALGSVSEV